MKKVSILIPAYNEQASLNLLYDTLITVIEPLNTYEWEILFINDGSKDNSLEIIKDLYEKDKRICYVDLSRNYGKEIAMMAGFDYVTGDCMVIMDADLQDPPSLIPIMLKYWEAGYDDVYAKRRTRDGESFFKKFTSKMFYKTLQKFTRVQIQKDTGDFRLIDRRGIDALRSIRETQRYTKGLFSWIGFSKKEILFDRNPRIAGSSKWNYFTLTGLAIEGVTSFTVAPLRLASYTGIIISFIAFIYMIFIILKSLTSGENLLGYASIMCITLFLGGIQLLFWE